MTTPEFDMTKVPRRPELPVDSRPETSAQSDIDEDNSANYLGPTIRDTDPATMPDARQPVIIMHEGHTGQLIPRGEPISDDDAKAHRIRAKEIIERLKGSVATVDERIEASSLWNTETIANAVNSQKQEGELATNRHALTKLVRKVLHEWVDEYCDGTDEEINKLLKAALTFQEEIIDGSTQRIEYDVRTATKLRTDFESTQRDARNHFKSIDDMVTESTKKSSTLEKKEELLVSAEERLAVSEATLAGLMKRDKQIDDLQRELSEQEITERKRFLDEDFDKAEFNRLYDQACSDRFDPSKSAEYERVDPDDTDAIQAIFNSLKEALKAQIMAAADTDALTTIIGELRVNYDEKKKLEEPIVAALDLVTTDRRKVERLTKECNDLKIALDDLKRLFEEARIVGTRPFEDESKDSVVLSAEYVAASEGKKHNPNTPVTWGFASLSQGTIALKAVIKTGGDINHQTLRQWSPYNPNQDLGLTDALGNKIALPPKLNIKDEAPKAETETIPEPQNGLVARIRGGMRALGRVFMGDVEEAIKVSKENETETTNQSRAIEALK